MKLFDVEISHEGSTATAALSGEIDMSTVEELEQRLESPLAEAPEVLELDFGKVSFLDSSGLRLLLRLQERTEGSGTRLVLTGVGRRVARVLELTGADEKLEISTDGAPAG